MKKRIALIMALILLLPVMSACEDAREINDWVYTYVIGVDKGVTDKLRFTILIPTLGGGQQGSGQDSSGSGAEKKSGDISVVSIDCPTIYSGLNLVNSFLAKRINYSHAKFFIIGEELAKEGIEPFMQGMRMTHQIRLNMHVMVVKGEALQFIEAFTPVVGVSIPRTMEGLLDAVGDTGLIDDKTYMEMLMDLKSAKGQASCILAALNKFDTFLPEGSEAEKVSVAELEPGRLARKGGNPAELIGAAVFRGDKLVGELNLGEARSLLMTEGRYLHGAFTIPDPLDDGTFVTIEAYKQKDPQIKVTVTGDRPVIGVKVFYEGVTQNQQNDIDYQAEAFKPVLEKSYEDFMVKCISETIQKCQELGSDIFGFGEIASMQFWTIQEWVQYGWPEKFKNAQVNVEASMIIRRTGVIVENNPIKGE